MANKKKENSDALNENRTKILELCTDKPTSIRGVSKVLKIAYSTAHEHVQKLAYQGFMAENKDKLWVTSEAGKELLLVIEKGKRIAKGE
jgi:predicted ArsR family transcriptional regulator